MPIMCLESCMVSHSPSQCVCHNLFSRFFSIFYFYLRQNCINRILLGKLHYQKQTQDGIRKKIDGQRTQLKHIQNQSRDKTCSDHQIKSGQTHLPFLISNSKNSKLLLNQFKNHQESPEQMPQKNIKLILKSVLLYATCP